LDTTTGQPADLASNVRAQLRLGVVGEGLEIEPTEALQRFYAEQGRYYAGGEVEPLSERLTQDVVWHVPGSNAIAGTYRGRAAVLAYFARRRALSNASFRVTPGQIMSSGQLLAQFAHGEAELSGQQVSWDTVGVFRIRAGQVAECWLVPFDQEQFDDLWS